MRPLLLLACAITLFLAIVWQMQPRAMSTAPATQGGDVELFRAIVVDLQEGQSYYDAVGHELRGRGYPSRDLFNWREPLLFAVLARLHLPVAQALLVGLCGWLLWPTLASSPMLTPLFLLNALIGVAAPQLVYVAEFWAGVCLALSAVALTKGQRTAGVALAILALAVRELAAPYCVGATLLAVWRRDWREVQRWMIGGLLYAGYYGWHAWQVFQHVHAGDPAHPHSWLAFGGSVFLLHALQAAGLWVVLPVPIFAAAMVCAVAAWWAPHMPVHVRMGVLVSVVFFLIAGQPFNVYWGWMVGPLLALWLAYAPSGIGALAAMALVAPADQRNQRSQLAQQAAKVCQRTAHIAVTQAQIPFDARECEVVAIAEGATWLKHCLSIGEQRALVNECRAIMDGPAGGYVPTVRGGGKMHVRMTCLGRHWNALTYKYESTRGDYDNAPVAPVPEKWIALASRIASEAGFAFAPDLCIMNWYDADGRMGLHQDKDEGHESIEAGLPVVSLSLGDTARFLFGGLKRRDPIESLLLESGDAFVFGGAARLRYHGVSRIVPGTAPAELGIEGRFNLTFRRY